MESISELINGRRLVKCVSDNYTVGVSNWGGETHHGSDTVNIGYVWIAADFGYSVMSAFKSKPSGTTKKSELAK